MFEHVNWLAEVTSNPERSLDHHPVFAHYRRYSGETDPGFSLNFLGVRSRTEFVRERTVFEDSRPKHVQTSYPKFDEEYFEWVDVLEAVQAATHQFTMLELGAGYGRWLVNSAAALRQVGKTFVSAHLIGVEAEPTHFDWMKTHFRDNGIDPEEHLLIQAAVTTKDGTAQFFTGHAREWWGQSITRNEGVFSRIRRTLQRANSTRPWADAKVTTVAAISLNTLLHPLKSVDLIDFDVQGSEYDILRSAATQIDHKVRRVHIGTHSKENETALRQLFQSMGWNNINDYSCMAKSQTPFGEISFQDGVQSWLNTKLH
jgi:FkbM family methyltransferase